MPSEDRRAPPPVTRAGSKAAASERRRRGRPRRDGVDGRAAPPPPPPPKTRKKGRSRGQAQVEDEEGVAATQKTPPTDKMKAEDMTSGRRGSASRRRSNTDPAPALPEAPPSDDPVPLIAPPTFSSEEEPAPTAPVATPPPQHSPAPSPSATPAEAEVGGASAGSSPARSPRPRLDDDDDAPSPLLRRSPSEDSGSPTPSLGHTERRLQQCAFCYRGDQPPMGQGPLVVFGPTPGYIPLHILSRRTSSDLDSDCHDHCYRRSQAANTSSSSPAQCDDESSFQLAEQLGAVGLPHDIDVQSLFDPTGQCCAHLQCAAWSEGVCRGEGQSLLYVDKAIDSGSTQACVFCGGLGASLRCREPGCGRSYHFPCAAAAGAHQDWQHRRTLCTRHAQAASRSCVSCSCDGDAGSLLMCCSCGNQYHARCLAPPLTPSSLIRAGWQCSPCRVCQSCRLGEDASPLLVCARCDKAYHPHCLTPPPDRTPDTKWTCQNCRVCLRCGVRSSGHWANHPFLCASCDPALPCPVCGRSLDLLSLQDYVMCVCCYRSVHVHCVAVEAGINATKCDDKSYICPTCQSQRAELAIPVPIPHSPANDVHLSPTGVPRVQSPPEVLPISTIAHSPFQVRSEQAKTPTEPTRLLHKDPVSCPADATDLQQSQSLSSSSATEHRLNLLLAPSDPAELPQSPTPSPPTTSEQRLSPVPSPSDPKELSQSPKLASPTELKPSPQSSPSRAPEEQLQQSPESCPSNPTNIRLSPTQSSSNPTDPEQNIDSSPTRTAVPRHSPLPSPANLTEFQCSLSSSLNHTQLHQSPSYVTELQTSLATSPFNPTQSSESLPQSPPDHSDLPLTSHPVPSSSNTTEIQKSPVQSLSGATDHLQSSVPSPSKITERQQSPDPSSVTELSLSPVPSLSKPTEIQRNSVPSPNSKDVHMNPLRSPSNDTELPQSPLPCPNITKFKQSPPFPSNVSELGLNPNPSLSKPAEFRQSPVLSLSNAKDQCLSPVSSPCNANDQCLSPVSSPCNPKALHQSPVPSPSKAKDLHQSPVQSPSKAKDRHLSPVPSPSNAKDRCLSPVQSAFNDTELQQSTRPPSVTDFQQSPTLSPSVSDLHSIPVSLTSKPPEFPQSLVLSPSNTKDVHQSPLQSPNISELQQCPLPSPSNTTDLHTSLDQSSDVTQLQKSPAPSLFNITELPLCSTLSLSKITELQQSPIPSSLKPTEVQESQVPSPSNVTELHQSPVSSPLNITDLQQRSTPSLSNVTEVLLSPTPSPSNNTELQQSLKLSSNVKELHRSPVLSPLNTAEPHQTVIPSPSKITEHCRSPVPFPSVIEFHQTPVQSPIMTALQQSPTSSTSNATEVLESPVLSLFEVPNTRLSPIPSTPIPTNVQACPVPSRPVPAELDESPVSLDSTATEHTRNSKLLGLDRLMVEKLAEAAELPECPASTHLSPVQVKNDPHGNHIPWECQENHAESPIIHFCSTPSPVSSVPLDMEPFPVLSTSAPAQVSPASSPSMPSTRDKLALEATPVQDSTMSELGPGSFDGDEAKPEMISPDNIEQDDGNRLSRPHSPADVTVDTPLLGTHEEKCPPELQCSPHVEKSLLQSPTQDVETVLAQESNISHSATFTLDKDLSSGSKHSACRSSSVPCSPSRVPLHTTSCSLSQPASPARMPSTQPATPLELPMLVRQFIAQLTVTTTFPHACGGTGTELRTGDITQNLNLDKHTLESTLCCSANIVPAPPSVSHPQSPLGDPPSPTPSSLVFQSTSVDRSSLVHVSSDAVEEVSCQSASLDCTLQSPKPLEQQASTVHIQASLSDASEMSASPASSLQASRDLKTEVTDPATVEPLPVSTSPLSQESSLVMLRDASSQPPAIPSSVLSTHTDTISPQNEDTTTPVEHLRHVMGLPTSPVPAGVWSPTGSVGDPEPPQLTESGQSSPLQVLTCGSPSEMKVLRSTNSSPTLCRPSYDTSDSQGLSIISSEASVCLRSQSSLQTCTTLRTCARASSSPTPTQTAEIFHGSTDPSLKSDAQATFQERKSVISTSLRHDSGPGLTSDSSWKIKAKWTSGQAGSITACQASPTSPCQSPAPLSPLNDRLPSSPTQEDTEMAETRCAHKIIDCPPPTHATQTHAVNRSQLSSQSRLANAQITPANPEDPETGRGPPRRAHAGPCPSGPTSTSLCLGEATSIYTMDREEHHTLPQHPPETTKGGVLNLENDEQEQEENEEQKKEKSKQEEMEVAQHQGQKEQEQEQEQEEEELSSPGAHLSPGEPAAGSSFHSGPPSPPASPPPSTSTGPLQRGDVSSEASLPLSQWGQEDTLCSQKMLEANKDVVQSHAEWSAPDALAIRPKREEVRESSSDGEGEPEASLDAEVMKLMTSSSPLCGSPRLPSSPSPPPLATRSLRRPPPSLPLSDELSIRLRQSPFSTEASPETSPVRVSVTPPPLSPPSPPLSFTPPYRESPPLCETPPSTVIPLTRKIGMGKPAISKRKFSPGRARVRQGSWWSHVRAVSPPSSSQDSTGEGCRDRPEFRQADLPHWSMRVGRGLGFPGRRRSRGGGVGGGRGGRGRSRIKTQDCLSVASPYSLVESVPPKQEEDNSMHNTVVMFSTSDLFTLSQDMCVVCGSFGQGAEGRLLSCSQCGQCYHPYCVNVKVTRVILTKGWRCLECTVCEACGEATDPGRLLLCDDCDISYHTYCLDPPLHTVPKGPWKCKWCVWCVQCGSASPGLRCDWQSNYSRCGPCASLTCCPLCQRAYTNDDLILQCQQCDRWVHALCVGLTTEDEVEIAADEGFHCPLCKSHSRIPYGRLLDNLDVAQILSRSREADTKTYSQDGVCLTESGLSQLQSLVEPLTSARRYRRCKPKLKLRIINQNSVSVLQTPPHPDTGHLECDLKSDSSPERAHLRQDDVGKDSAKRKRKPYRPGIGGFMVRQRGGKAAGGAVKVCGGRDASEVLRADEDGDKVKKRYRKKKTKLEEAFPSYLQEAFFGRDLLYRIRQVDPGMLTEVTRIRRTGALAGKSPAPSEKLMNRKQERLALSDDALVDLRDVLDTHPHILATGHAVVPLPTSELTGTGGRAQKALHEEPLDAILNPELDKIVTDGAILSKLYKIPELEGKDVEELFTAVLSPDTGEQHNQHARTAAAGVGAFPRPALLNGLAGRPPPDVDAMPGGTFRGSAPCLLPTVQVAGEGEHDAVSTAQRGMLKWEKEEALGEQATVAPVLYCNTNFPHLRDQHPEWSARVKQIAKLWRKASSQDRAPYVQRARDNRAAQRINKVHHLPCEPPRRAPPSQPPPLQGSYEGVSPEADSTPKDPLRPKESQQEQEWKLRQQMRQKSKQQAKMEATQKLEQVKNEQQRQHHQQQLSANQQPDVSPDFQARQNLLQGSSSVDNVFLRPQVPPPSGYSSLPHSPHSPHSSSPLQQPPSSPQVFSPPSSRPTSPWDPYSKPAGTPRPASVQRCPLLSVSPAHDSLGSPAPSPDSKASDGLRTLAPQLGLQHSGAAMKSPPSGSQVYHRSQVQGGVFKAPMPPQNQLQQELFGARRELGLHQPQDPAFHCGLDSPQSSSYAPSSGVDNSQQSSLPLRPSHNTYTTSPTSGPHNDGSYMPNPNLSLSLDHLKMVSGRRPSPSRPTLDTYASHTGTVPERFPPSPGGALTSDPYARAAGTPRPSADPYAQRPPTPHPQKTPETFGQAQVESLAPQLVRSSVAGEIVTHEQSPQPDSFPRTPAGSQTPKHRRAPDDRFPSGRVTCGAPQTDKMAANDTATPSEGPLCLLPQVGDSQEKLKQRQRLRQLILRQQQQKSALRQDKGLQEGGPSAVTPGAATPHRWLQDAAAAAPTDVFGRPPPPYPGALRLPRPPGAYPGTFPGEQPRGLTPSGSPFPVPRATPLRFGLQDSFHRPPLALVPGAGLAGPRIAPAPVHGEMIAIRQLPASSPQPHVMSVAPQAFPVPRALSVQQHNIMGQPYIELRHRAPENRLRLPFSLTVGPASEAPSPVPQPSAPRPGPGARTGETPTGRPVLPMVPQQNLVQAPTLGPGNDAALQRAEGVDEHLEGVDSAVKDLEDVEVKDLVDLNLNLDPEDGKEDLDLGANDLHLDDFLLSGKFDLIAYADPELNLDDKKDMFNEELDLGESAGDKKDGARKADNRADVKEGGDESVKADPQDQSAPLHLLPQPRKLPGPDGVFGPPAVAAGAAQPSSSLQLAKGELGESGSGSGILPELQAQGKVLSYAATPTLAPGTQPGFQQRAPGPPSSYFAPPPQTHPLPSQGLPSGSGPHSVSLRLPQPRVLLATQAQPPQLDVLSPTQDQDQDQDQDQNKGKALLLEEQPLLLQDLLDQERQEQQQQKQMQALIRQKSTSDPGIPDLDFDSISDPIMKAKMVALKGINKVMSQGNLGLNRFHQAPGNAASEATTQPPLSVGRDAELTPQVAQPGPPSCGPGFGSDARRHQYEEWLGETQQLLQIQQRLLEDQIAVHRKTKKALSAKQRTAKKAGRALAEEDAAQLHYVVEQQSAVQKQLEQIRKQQKDHTVLIEDYKAKRRQQRAPVNVLPLQNNIQNIPHGWSPAGLNLTSRPPPPMSPARPTTPQVAAVAPGLPAPAAGFAPAAHVSAPSPQVKFDDNNPFSEGFQERERRERLREQQERHKVQLMHGVERHQMLHQQRMDLDQQGLRSGPAGPGSNPSGEGLPQVPFFSSELPQDFLQSPPSSGAPLFPQAQQGFTAGPRPDFIPDASPERGGVLPAEAASSKLQAKARPAGGLDQVRASGAFQTPSKQGGQGHPLGPDSASSSPSAALQASFSSSPLPQLYADILPDEGLRRRRRRSVHRDRDNAGGAGGTRTPLSTHSDDITAPPTPAFSDTSCSTPTRSGAETADFSLPLSALAPSSELERQLSVVCAARERSSLLSADAQGGFLCGNLTTVKEERVERGSCGGNPVKSECTSPLHAGSGGDPGKELLRHLLKEKNSPAKTASPSRQAPPAVDGAGFYGNLTADGPDVPDLLGKRKAQRCKRAARPDKDKTLAKYKRRRREDGDCADDDDDDERALDCSSSSPSEQIMTHLTQLTVLPLMEPVLGLDLSPFPPYGSSSLGRDSRLSGSFGSACLDGVADYYAQLTCKNLLGNPPTPPASLPPTPPPKLVNGFAAAEEVSRKDDLDRSAVDVPASLPTPPHNNQEELRVRDSSPPCDSPDGFVPSSSPESVADAEVSRYPDLSFVKTEAPSPCPSPPIPIVPCSWGKGSALKREVKTEPDHPAPPVCSKTDLVTIAITLNPTGSQNVPGVMAAVAELLRVPSSIDYRLSRAQCAPTGPTDGVSAPPQTSSSRQQRTAPPADVRTDPIQRGAISQPPSCSFCKVLLGKVKEAKQEARSGLLFCSADCSALYSSGPKSGASADRPADQRPPPSPPHRYANNMSSIAVHSLPTAPARTAGSSPPLRFPPASAVTMETKPRADGLKVKVKLKPRPYAFSEGDGSLPGKRVKGSRWRRWNVNVALSRGPISDKAAAMPTEEEADVLLKKLGACLRPDPFPADRRRCCFCHQQGDGETDGPARLLNLDLDLWVHLNCALWSSEVYETQAGALINVELALRRSLTLRCAHCQQTGATSGCNRLRCANTYHFTCALRAHCTFFKDKTMLCQLHRPRTGPAGSPPSAPDPRDPYDSELRRFAVFRRVYVQRDEARQLAAMVQRGEAGHTFRVGSLLFCAVGRLLPRQMNAFHDADAIFPVGYHADRIYWSMRHGNRRCKYMCFIEEHDARPLFKVKVVEKGYDDLVLTASTPKGVWEQILEPVARLRSSGGTLKLFPDFLKGEDLFGLSASAVSRIVESLPGVEACERYTFRYGRNPLMEWPLAFNPSGSARSEPKVGAAKRPYLPAGAAPRCQGSVGSIVGPVPGVISLSPGETVAGAHQGRHSKLAQYRRMKADWKTNVYLARSRIQGLGLYAARDIEKCTMVIEYIGAIIRSEVANRKERLYESQNRGVYMFRIDNDHVIDATITGGPARYINHSCAPNCITEVVSVDKENKIIISSCRRIQRGEELSYDYKFDLEDDQHKIPCHCGAFNCRKWMN